MLSRLAGQKPKIINSAPTKLLRQFGSAVILLLFKCNSIKHNEDKKTCSHKC